MPCEHAGAAFSLILEEKLALGLADAPPERAPVESQSEEALVAQALAERKERARPRRCGSPPSTRKKSGPTTRSRTPRPESPIASRCEARRPGESYCSCPDFRKNTLGTCKHILHALEKVRRRFPDSVRDRPYRQRNICVHLSYSKELELRILLPNRLDDKVSAIVRPIRDRPITDLADLLKRIRRLEGLGFAVTMYPDAEEYIQTRLLQQRITATVADIRRDPKSHSLRKTLLKVELLPYQLDGIAFAAGAGARSWPTIWDSARRFRVSASRSCSRGRRASARLWSFAPPRSNRNGAARSCASQRDCQIVLGGAAERAAQYENECFFTVCNYEQVLRDILAIERVKWDLIILDEGQRIKNWEAKTTRIIKSLRSPFALVLSGTPLENRLDDLFSVVEFVDDRRLGPAFRFFHRHRDGRERKGPGLQGSRPAARDA